jgi:mono/diheme cytochrome c family protein
LCHALKHAGATGEIGPALDDLKPDAARVEKAIRNGIGQMPANTTLTDAQIRLLAQYVARATGAAQ